MASSPDDHNRKITEYSSRSAAMALSIELSITIPMSYLENNVQTGSNQPRSSRHVIPMPVALTPAEPNIPPSIKPGKVNDFEVFGPFVGSVIGEQLPANSNGDNQDLELTLKPVSTSAELAQTSVAAAVQNVLVIGQTGSGKSTLINYLANMDLDGPPKALKIVTLDLNHTRSRKSEASGVRNVGDQTQSQTNNCAVYSFDTLPGFNFIDTPGLSDTAGIAQDEENVLKIQAACRNIDRLTGIILVANGTTTRDSASLKNAISRLRGFLPNIVRKNMMIVLTNCTRLTCNYDLAQLKPWEFKPEHVFHMQNSALCRGLDDGPLDERELIKSWQTSISELKRLLTAIGTLDAISTESFGAIEQSLAKIKADLRSVLMDISSLQTVQSMFEQHITESPDAAGDALLFADYKSSKVITCYELQDADTYSTFCNAHLAMTCHANCKVAWPGARAVGFCSQLRFGKCFKCFCGHKQHYLAKKVLVKKEQTLAEILQAMLERQNSASMRNDSNVMYDVKLDNISRHQATAFLIFWPHCTLRSMEQRNMEMRALSSLARELRLTESAPAVLWNRGFRTVKKIQDSTPDQLRRLNLPKKDTDALILYSDRVHESPPTQPIPDTTSQPGGGTNVQLVGGQSHLGHETPRVVHHPSHDNCESIKDYNIFLIGETGAGKSTLVNYLVNGPNADLNNLKVAVPNRFYETTGNYMDHERNRADQTKSQTVGCTTYSFMGENACRYHVIDTPGLSDTRNDADPHQDDKNIDLILQAAEEAGNLSAIIVVINGTVPRFNASVKNAIERMRGNIPDALLQNIMILLTNCSRIGANFDVEVLPWRITENNVFAMNNAAFSHSPERLRDDERMMSELISHFANSKDTIRCLLARVRELSSVSTEVFRVIRENRDHIKSGVQSLLLGIRNILEVQGQLQLLTTDHQFALTSLQQFSAFKEKHYVEYYELKDSNSSGMFCGNHPNITCHKECKVWSKDPGSLLLILCEKMSMGRCTVCQCPYKAHHRAAKELIKSRKTLAAIVDAAKLGLPSVNEEKTAIKLATEMLEMDVAALRLAANAKHNEILDCIRKLKEVCSGYNFVAETKSVVGILENGRYGIRDAGILQDLDKYIGEINAMLNQYSFGDGIS